MKQSVKLEAKIDKARELANAGKLIQARDLLTRVLQKDPKNGRALDGVRAITKALNDADPNRALRAQVIEHLKNGRPAFALPLAAELVRLAPQDGPAANLLGMAQGSLGKPTEAASSFEKACKLAPNVSGHWFNLGKVRTELDQPKLAISAFERAYEFNKDHPPTALALAKAYLDHGHYLKGARHLQGMNDHYPNNASIKINLAQAWYHLGQIEKADDIITAAMKQFPKNVDLMTTKGQIHRANGEFAEARLMFEAVLAEDPDYAPAHLGRSSVTRYTPDDPQIAALERLTASDPKNAEAHASYWFALGKAYEDTNKLEPAFRAYEAGNERRKSTLPDGMVYERHLFEALRKLPINDWPRIKANSGSTKMLPVFIVGMPRSGTTLVETILSRHPLVSAAGELTSMANAIADVFPQLQEKPLPQTLVQIRDSYLSEAKEFAGKNTIVTDKMPLNFRWIGIISAVFPEARVIHLKRDPMAIAWSIFKRNLDGGGNRFAFSLDDIAEYLHMHHDLMDHWRKTCPAIIHDVQYEQLTETPEVEIRKILQHVGLDWNAACLSPEQSKRAVITSSDTQVRKGIYSGSSEEWRKFAEFLDPIRKKFPKD